MSFSTPPVRRICTCRVSEATRARLPPSHHLDGHRDKEGKHNFAKTTSTQTNRQQGTHSSQDLCAAAVTEWRANHGCLANGSPRPLRSQYQQHFSGNHMKKPCRMRDLAGCVSTTSPIRIRNDLQDKTGCHGTADIQLDHPSAFRGSL